jgi:hypothetical protein
MRPLPGWPVGGPAEPTGAPAVGDLDGDGLLELVAMGGFDALVSTRPTEREVTTRRVGELRVYGLTAPTSAPAPWPQGRGDAWNTGAQRSDDTRAGIAAPLEGPGLLSSLAVYPSPALGPTVRVRAWVGRGATVEGWLYNLEGQEVRALPPVHVSGAASYDEEVSIEGLASGYYVCRLRAGGEAVFCTFVVAR